MEEAISSVAPGSMRLHLSRCREDRLIHSNASIVTELLGPRRCPTFEVYQDISNDGVNSSQHCAHSLPDKAYLSSDLSDR